MKHTLIAAAIFTASTLAQAVEWVHIANNIHLDVAVVADARGAIAVAQDWLAPLTAGQSGKWVRYLAFTPAAECRQGFGYIYTSDLNGNNIRQGGAFVLRNLTSVADAMADHLCRHVPR